jgi:Ca2+:H+ antiporter
MLARQAPVLFPLLALAFFGDAMLLGVGAGFQASALGIGFAIALLPILFGTVFAAMHHAEDIAHRLGEPFGTLLLSLAVTIIEVALLLSLMLGPEGNPALVRDTVFSVIMIVCNGLVGLCIVLGGLRYREQGFLVTGASAYLTVLIALGTITLILPNYTWSTPGPAYSPSQLAFVSIMTILLYGVFLYIQTARHQDYFAAHPAVAGNRDAAEFGAHRSFAAAWLVAALAGVILLSKKFAAVLGAGIDAVGAPAAVTGVLVALLILTPESVAALRAARSDQLQKSLNLALGSSIATIGLTVPAVAAVNIIIRQELLLGLPAKDMVLLALTFLISLVTFGTGRTNILLGFVHLVIFASYVFLVFEP